MKLFSYSKRSEGPTAFCFFETDIQTFTKDLCAWWSELDWQYDCFNINGLSWLEFFERYDNLSPRYIITPTRSNWVVFFDNSVGGDIYLSVLRHMAKRLKIRSVGVTIEDDKVARMQNRPFGIKFWYVDRRNQYPIDRYITLIRDGNKWNFDLYGDPLQFEKTYPFTGENWV